MDEDWYKFRQELRKELEDHITVCNERFEYLDKRMLQLIECQEANTRAVTDLTVKSAGVIELYQNLGGAIKTGVAVQRFGIWIVKWPLVGAGLYTAYQWLIERLPG